MEHVREDNLCYRFNFRVRIVFGQNIFDMLDSLLHFAKVEIKL